MSEQRDLSDRSDEELVAELARRRAEGRLELDNWAFELSMEADARRDGARAMQAYLDAQAAQQTPASRPCPHCGAACRVRRRSVARTVRSRHGEHRLARHYHYCQRCAQGFYPLDVALGLGDEGELTSRMEQVVLDLGLHGTFEEAAERFALHHGGVISENLVRRVVDRVGRCAQAHAHLGAQLRAPAAQPPATLVVEVDGSMIPTRGPDPWREVKVGLVARGEHFVPNKGRSLVTQARFVARLGDYEGFKHALTDILTLERAWECPHLVVIGDGAPWVWTLADEVCYGATQILDYPHAIAHATETARVIFGTDDHLVALWTRTVERLLWEGRVDDLVHEVEACVFGARRAVRQALVDLARYYRTNAARMRYDRYRAAGLPCGSGAVESAHRHVLQKRMKLAGQHWSPERADRLAQLRAALATCGPAALYPAIRRTGSYG
jgi:hypothetical protein